MMKFVLVLIFQLCIANGIFCNEYWRTRSLSGSDYGVEYNLNNSKTNKQVGTPRRKLSYRPTTLFDWNPSPVRNNNSQPGSDYDPKIMAGDTNGERNHSNIWWPWSNYEEWASAHAQGAFINPKRPPTVQVVELPLPPRKFTVPIPTTNTGQAVNLFFTNTTTSSNNTTKLPEEKRRRRKGKKRRNRKKKKHGESTTTTTTTTTTTAIAMSNFIPTISNQIPPVEGGNNDVRPVTSLPGSFFGPYDNNEMDNEIRPVHSNNNYYNSIPVVDKKHTLNYKIKKNQTLKKFFKGYAVRNFTDDINECLVNNGGCEGLCINTPGSYKCHCPDGFRVDGNKCADINECLLRNGHGPCQDQCINQWGSYRCTCDSIPGTRLAADGHTCEDIDECKEGTAGCSHECINTVGSAFCLCPKGYMLGLDWKTCHDIDECNMPDIQEIRCEGRCENTIGSYVCLN